VKHKQINQFGKAKINPYSLLQRYNAFNNNANTEAAFFICNFLGLSAFCSILSCSSGYHCIAFGNGVFLLVLLWLLWSPHQHYKKITPLPAGLFRSIRQPFIFIPVISKPKRNE
jgi:hypothetical protein